MNRDALLATAIGFIIGIGITSIVLFGPNVLKSLPNVTLPNISLPRFALDRSASPAAGKPVKTEGPITKLTIDSPQPESIVQTATLTVQGRVPGEAVIIIGGYLDETITKPDANGNFSGNVTLTEGMNEITVASVQNQATETEILQVYFTEEKL